MRTKSGLKFLLLIAVAILNVGSAADNPLVGSWRWDNEKTLSNFKFPDDGSDEQKKDALKARRFVESVAREIRSNVTLTYEDREYTQTTYDNEGRELNRVSAPYKIVKVSGNSVIVDQFEHGHVVELFLEGDSFYVEVKVGAFTYRDYFTRYQPITKKA
jgi:hypothetical protein